MKHHIDQVIVVEGKADEAYLSSFIDAVFVTTNGYEIPKEEIEFLNNPRNKNGVIVLTDSDEAGKQIRNRLDNLLINKTHVEVDVVKCNKNNKHGVAECEKEELLNVLKRHFVEKKQSFQLSLSDLVGLSIDKEKRDHLRKVFELGKCNSKAFLKRINYLNINKEELSKELNKYGNQ